MNLRLGVSAVIALLLTVGTTATVWAAVDRSPPTRPTNLRAPSFGFDHIGLAWDASFDNSGRFSYRIYREDMSAAPVTVPKTQRAYTWRGLEPGRSYRFYVTAVDDAGNVSLRSNILTASTNGDIFPPSAPSGLTVTERTSTSVSLSWTAATDNIAVNKNIVFVNNSHYGFVTYTSPTTAKVFYLASSTTYDFHVRAEDTSRNVGPPSNTVSATTLPSTDTTPPTVPANLTGTDYGCAHFELNWTASHDNADPENAIRYDVFVNGVLFPQASVTGLTFTDIEVPGGETSFVVTARDRSGNTSAASNPFVVIARFC